MLLEPQNNSAGEAIKLGVDLKEKAKVDPTIYEGVQEGYQPHRDPTEWDLEPVPVTKAYRNQDFLNSAHARHLRILAEYEETMQRLRASGVRATIQVFGSARAKDRGQYDRSMAELVEQLEAAKPGSEEHAEVEERITKLKSIEWMCDYMASIEELARRLTEWSMGKRQSRQMVSGVDRTKSALRASFERNLSDLCDPSGRSSIADSSDRLERELSAAGELNEAQKQLLRSVKISQPAPTSPVLSFSKSPVPHRRFAYLPHSSEDNHPESRAPKAANLFIATGGGPGFMEAANRGASRVPGGRSAGMGISLPFETGLNPYVTPELAFEYHYFFTRKFAMAYYMQALVAAPGGFGTMDEFFELITLKQTGKMNQAMPVVLFGKKYWNTVVNWHAIADFGTINRKEVDEILFTDSVDEAFDYITSALEKMLSSKA